MKILTIVDTDILIDAAMKISEAVNCLDETEQRAELAVSAITQMELISGCRNKTELKKTDRFLQRFRIIGLNEKISDKAVELIKQVDLLTMYINDKNSSTIREFITVTLAGYEHKEGKTGYNGFKQDTFIAGKTLKC